MNIKRIATWFGVILFQLILTQVSTFIFSMFLGDVERVQQTQPVLFLLIAGISFYVGIFLAGWIALKMGWIQIAPKLLWRAIGTIVGVALPLAIALFVSTIEAGNPFFAISMFMGIAGFYLGGWIGN